MHEHSGYLVDSQREDTATRRRLFKALEDAGRMVHFFLVSSHDPSRWTGIGYKNRYRSTFTRLVF